MSDAKSQARTDDQEPSMEEILSSIRKIIAADETDMEKPQPATRQAARAVGGESEEVLELTEVVQEEEGATRWEPAAASDLGAREERARVEPKEGARPIAAAESTPQPKGAAVLPEPSLVSEAVASAATAAFAKLTRSVGRQESGPITPDSGKSVEVFIADLLRPLLKEWLDRNLPALVERVVEREVKNLAKRAELL